MSPRLSSSIGIVVTFLFASFFSNDLSAGGRRRAVAAPRPPSALAITFVGGPESSSGWVDAGRMAWDGTSARVARSVRTVALRIGPPSPDSRGTAILRAFLEAPDSRYVVRVDGIVLSSVPQIIQRHAPIGLVVTRRIEIEVPASAPDGPIAVAIGWEVSTD